MSIKKHRLFFWLFLLVGLGIILYYDWRLIILFVGVIFVIIAFYHLSKILEWEKQERKPIERK